MNFNFLNLDDITRKTMLIEVESDIANGTLYMSTRFNETGLELYPELLKKAVIEGNEESLAIALKQSNCFESYEIRKNGVTAAVPVTASQTLADGEFNRFYIRALCVRAGNEERTLEVYRAKAVSHPRTESAAMNGKAVDANVLLNDLRTETDKAFDTILNLPSGPNSGLSVKIV